MANATHGYNIGAVSRLTGIARERIRIWERRYGAVVPERDAGNNRLYSRQDIDRLTLIRRLVDTGHAIGQVARLSLDELESRLADAGTPRIDAAAPARVLVLGPDGQLIASQLHEWNVPEVLVVSDVSEAAPQLAQNDIDLIAATTPALTSQELAPLLGLRRLAPRCPMLVVYRFAPRGLLEQLSRIGIRTVKAPLQPDDLSTKDIAEGQAGPSTPAGGAHDYRTRQFTVAELERLAARRSAVACECPQHLANLVRDLQAFEDYTLACEATHPADADLHREIHATIARARALTEDALGIVAAEEGLLQEA